MPPVVSTKGLTHALVPLRRRRRHLQGRHRAATRRTPRKIKEHLINAQNVQTPNRTVMNYLETKIRD